MTFREWEKRFKKALKGVSKQEKERALEYYRELYGDKIDAGCAPEEAVTQFGSPIDCAQNILADSETVKTSKTKRVKTSAPQSHNLSTHSVSVIIGMVFLTLLLIIPLYACLLVIVVSVGAATIVCAVCGVASLLLTVVYPIYITVYGASWAAVVANVGMCLASAGVCALLAIGFFFLTKYMILWSIQLFKKIYFKGDRS